MMSQNRPFIKPPREVCPFAKHWPLPLQSQRLGHQLPVDSDDGCMRGGQVGTGTGAGADAVFWLAMHHRQRTPFDLSTFTASLSTALASSLFADRTPISPLLSTASNAPRIRFSSS